MDASNYTGHFTAQMMQDLKARGVVGIIIQAITGLDGVSYTSQQCQMARDWGFRIQGYVWAFPGESIESIDGRLSMFNGHQVEKLWDDVEQAGLSERDVDILLVRCDMYLPQQRSGIYSGKWFFDQQGWSSGTRWSDRDLWDSNYDGVAVVSADFRPYGGWDHCAVKQFRGTSDIGHVHQIDLDVT